MFRPLITVALFIGAAVYFWLQLESHTPVKIPAGMSSANVGMAERGAYLVRAAGCQACHWDKANGGQPFTGGLALKSPFGTFYSPNITPDEETGIGKWSDEDFVRALTEGEGVHGEQLYPAFPYTSYAAMRVEDVLAIKAYLFTLSPVSAPAKEHEATFPVSWRPVVKGWKFLSFAGARPLANDPSRDVSWNRGRYLVAVGHCGECHTPRNSWGAPATGAALQGNPQGIDGWKVPALVGATAEDFSRWSVEETAEYLKSGVEPSFDSVQGPMADVIEEGTTHLSDEDRLAIALYLKSLNGN